MRAAKTCTTTNSCTAANALYFDMPGRDLRAEGVLERSRANFRRNRRDSSVGGCRTTAHGVDQRLANARESGMRMINPTIATTITMTTTFGSLKLWLATTSAAAMLRWAVPKRQDPSRVVVRSAEQPANAKAQSDKQKPSKDAAGAEDLQNLVDVRCGDQQYQQDEADVGNPVEHGLHPCGQVLVTRLQGKARWQAGAASAGRGSEQSSTDQQ